MRFPERTTVWLVLVAALIAAAILIGKTSAGSSRSRMLVLEDGGRLRLLATTQGTNHLWVAGRFPDLAVCPQMNLSPSNSYQG